MTIDFHYHVDRAATQHLRALELPAGCVVARRVEDNVACEGLLPQDDVTCAFYADPRAPGWQHTVRLVSQGKGLAYTHLELFDSADLHLMEPVLAESERRGVPVILHMSRHDRSLFEEDAAARALDYVLGGFPNLLAIVSHCGGENVAVVTRAARECPRILLDTSCLEETSLRSGQASVEAMLMSIAEALPPNRLLYGSDRCWPRQSETFGQLPWLASAFDDLDDICINNGKAILASLKGSATPAQIV